MKNLVVVVTKLALTGTWGCYSLSQLLTFATRIRLLGLHRSRASPKWKLRLPWDIWAISGRVSNYHCFPYPLSVELSRPSFVPGLHTLFIQVVLFEELVQVLVTAECHHLQLFLRPWIQVLGPYLREVDAQSTVDTRAIQTYEDAIVNRSPGRVGWTYIHDGNIGWWVYHNRNISGFRGASGVVWKLVLRWCCLPY